MKKLLLVAVLSAATVTTYADSHKQVKFTDSNKPILVKKNDREFKIIVKSNRTTGYMWLLTSYNRKLVKPDEVEYVAPKAGKPGQGGYEEWEFDARKKAFKVPQVTEIKMIYAKPWELKSSNTKTFKIVLVPNDD